LIGDSLGRVDLLLFFIYEEPFTLSLVEGLWV
jgi:hypothetical protein